SAAWFEWAPVVVWLMGYALVVESSLLSLCIQSPSFLHYYLLYYLQLVAVQIVVSLFPVGELVVKQLVLLGLPFFLQVLVCVLKAINSIFLIFSFSFSQLIAYVLNTLL